MTCSIGTRAGRARVLAVVALSLLAGCATTPRDAGERDPYDPFEPLNRKVFAFNQAADRYLLRPVASGYDSVVPGPIKTGVGNFFDNLSTPIWVLNHLLQGQFGEAGRQGGRFFMNSTVGIGGLLDVATPSGVPRRRASFDQTFGKWGVPSGPYLMVPLLGPNTARSGLGWYARYHTDVVWNYLDDNRSLRDKLVTLEIIETRRGLLGLDRMLDQASDPYLMMRDAYRQRVEFEIRGSSGDDEFFEFDDFDDFDDEDDRDEDG
mgnify:CR=1 FL=1